MFYSASSGGFYHWRGTDDAVEITEKVHKALLEGQSLGKIIVADSDGYPYLADPIPISLDRLATHKRSEIDAARDTALHSGLSYTMPDGTQETVQTRAQDEPNLLGLAIEARDLKAEGVTDPVLILRVESNRNYELTPQQMIELTDAAKNHKKLILAKSWQLKDAVDAIVADDGLDETERRELIEKVEW